MSLLNAIFLLAALDPAPLPPPAPPPLPEAPAPPLAPEPKQPLSLYQLHLAVDLPVIALGAGLGFMRVYFREQLARKSCPCDPTSVNALDRHAIGNHSHAASVAADVTVPLAMGLPVLADLFDVGVSRPFSEDVLVFIETLYVQSGLQNAMNFAVARPRPRTYAGDPKFVDAGEGYLSFYAGHVASTFAALSAASFTLDRRHDQHVWPWIVTAVVGGSVAFERVASGHHFPTDVVTGAIVGTATGIAVPWLHLRKLPVPVTIAPSEVGSGLALVGRF